LLEEPGGPVGTRPSTSDKQMFEIAKL